VFMVEERMEESMAPWRGHTWCFDGATFFNIYLRV
jgi:hypothetical protein